MAKFLQAFKKTMEVEGLYSNDKEDIGGETFMGISRVYNPYWEGWKYIDKGVEEKELLFLLVKNFYYANYWNRIKGSDISSQRIANEVFDTAVNLGVKHSIKFLQRTLNMLLKEYKLKIDGLIGNKTLVAINVLYSSNEDIIVKCLDVLQGGYYFKITERREKNIKFFKGWINKRIGNESNK